jgi:hypothetical protein
MTAKLPTEPSFGLGVGGVCVALGAWLWWRGSPTIGPVLLVTGTLLVGLGLVAPMALRVPNRIWWRVALVLGWVNTRILLTLFFAVVLTPVGVVRRIFGHNPLRGARVQTNWTPYPPRRRDARHFERLF